MNDEVITTRELLRAASNEDLDPLVEYILKAATEGLKRNKEFKRYHPDHSRYPDVIFEEIKLFGGNTFVNVFRKEGPPYREVLEDVARKVKVKDVEKYSVVELEWRMIEELLRKAGKSAEGKEGEELEEALRHAGLSEKDYKKFIAGASISALLGRTVYSLFMYKSSTFIASTVAKQVLGHSLRVGAGVVAGRGSSFLLGPVAWVLMGMWAAFDISGPAYRVTMPCVFHIAMLRQKWIVEQEVGPLEEVFNG